jgi:hypothetical protein
VPVRVTRFFWSLVSDLGDGGMALFIAEGDALKLALEFSLRGIFINNNVMLIKSPVKSASEAGDVRKD